MTPAGYVDKPSRYTAVQWDGTDESAAWIVENYPYVRRDGEEIIVQDALDREHVLPASSWVVRQEGLGPGGTQYYDPQMFDRLFERA